MPSAAAFPPKDPLEKLDYAVDWGLWLALGETIASATWSITGPDDELMTFNESIAGSRTIMWLVGGTAITWYVAHVHIVTSAGREAERGISIVVGNRTIPQG